MRYGTLDFSDQQNVKLVLNDKSCVALSFVLSSNNRVTGRVFGADGRALPNVCLNLKPKEKPVSGNRIFDCTNAEGRYEMEEIPPGEYLIVVNSEGKISSDEPFPTVYFPGVFEKDKATTLTISQTTKLEDYDIHIPSQESRHVLQGVLQYLDGRPVVDESVEFQAENAKEGVAGEARATTDAEGRFSLNVLRGLKGTLRGIMYTYEGEYENCPKLEKLIKAKGQSVPDIGTKPIALEITRDIQDIKLTFPFPYCKKTKDN